MLQLKRHEERQICLCTNAKEGRVHGIMKSKMRKLTLESVKEFNSNHLSVTWQSSWNYLTMYFLFSQPSLPFPSWQNFLIWHRRKKKHHSTSLCESTRTLAQSLLSLTNCDKQKCEPTESVTKHSMDTILCSSQYNIPWALKMY